MNVTKFNISGISNSSDIESLRGTVQSINGVHAVRVDNVANTVTVEYEDNVSKEKLSSTIGRYRKNNH